MTRIVAGIAGGRRLAVPPKGTRPTAERVREALFNSLETMLDFTGARILDLYAGSGAFGLEALSRGAELVTLVENDRKAADIIRRNIDSVGLPGAELRHAAVATVLAQPATVSYDVIFVDPPYSIDTATVTSVLSAALAHNWLAPAGIVVVERDARDGEIDWPPPLAALRRKRYGDTILHWAECP